MPAARCIRQAAMAKAEAGSSPRPPAAPPALGPLPAFSVIFFRTHLHLCLWAHISATTNSGSCGFIALYEVAPNKLSRSLQPATNLAREGFVPLQLVARHAWSKDHLCGRLRGSGVPWSIELPIDVKSTGCQEQHAGTATTESLLNRGRLK